ncbi:hypothetical protein IMCC3317_26280 [Kordia antarctica]|uniref:Glycosyltransferase RgtA/B/C/D-like domain-containing protein n=1 Tax=Kordia antarctica TaxID=1218801 RepID=A0A7L4ZL49_9FLAO|nr:hypothetical protein [Kordia antarctica]QHI37250.1 hypothetical protein IMCC3317_26280 [Kordia antarctica]
MKWFKQKWNSAIGILFLITFVIVLRNPIEYFPDSAGYLDMHIIRTPGYPLFLQFMKLLFGTGFDTATVVFQAIFGCFSIYFFIHKLRSSQLINDFFSVCFAFVLLLPFVSGGKIANNILSEAISYGLYLLITGYYISFFISKNKKELLYALPLLALLLITRYQFVYLIPLALLMIFWVSFKKREFKQYTLLIVLFLSLPLITSLVDKTYHKIVHNHFVSTPWTGMSIITPALFVADAEDVKLFDTAIENEFFSATYSELLEKNMNINNLKLTSSETPTLYYIHNYANIQMGPIFKNGNAVLNDSLSKSEKFIALNTLISNVSKPLIWDNFSKWKRIFIRNMIFGFGGIKYLMLYVFIAFFSFFALLKRAQKEYKVLLLISLFLIGNIILVSIGMHAVVRFTFYNDWVLFLTIFILLNSLNKKLYES